MALDALFTAEGHVQIEATWGIYQAIVAATGRPPPSHGRKLMRYLTDSLRSSVPAALTKIITLGRTPNRAGDILAYFDRSGTSNGPTEASKMVTSSFSEFTAVVLPRIANADQ